MARDFMDVLFQSHESDAETWRGRYEPPEPFPHHEWAKVAVFPGEGDGQTVEVDEMRMPARSYRLRVLPGPNSVGEPQAGYTVRTGSGAAVAKLAAELAETIAEGMVSFYPEDEPTHVERG